MLPTITFLRHAEKQLGDVPPRGVGIDGDNDPESLTVLGWQRAGALGGLFLPRSGSAGSAPAATPVPTPTHLFASRVGDLAHDSQRPRETLRPLSLRLGIAIDERFMKDDLAGLAAAIGQCTGSVVVAWEHKRIPPLVTLLMGGPTGVPQTWPDDRYDVLWILEPDATGAHYELRQVPEMLLAGDRDQPI